MQRRQFDKKPRWWDYRLRGTQEGVPGWNSRPWLSERILVVRHDPLKIAVGVAGGCWARRVKCFVQRRHVSPTIFKEYSASHSSPSSVQLRRDSQECSPGLVMLGNVNVSSPWANLGFSLPPHPCLATGASRLSLNYLTRIGG